jgi:hypothetical protein
MLTYADAWQVLHSAVVYPGDFCSLPQVFRLSSGSLKALLRLS